MKADYRGPGLRGWLDRDGETALRCIYKSWLGRVVWDVRTRHGRATVERSTARLILRGLLSDRMVAVLRAAEEDEPTGGYGDALRDILGYLDGMVLAPYGVEDTRSE